ncbi:MAG TPA: DUF2127 domain-containing protein [Tepidisphaeraceae bacterium]|jgi:uncharacterized membrane protein (DUF2068 family)|nr:DUF2127 domain-containing protein [Tepidisphaeraceae bacterium]
MAWIIVYKAVKVVLATAGGVAAIRLGRHDLVAMAQRWLPHAGVDPDGLLGTRVLAKIAGINAQSLQWTGCVLFVYAVLYAIEAIGLYREKLWAEWFTTIQTALLIPLEIYAIARRPGPLKFGALLLSGLTVTYLLWRIHRDRKQTDCARRSP